MTKSLTVAELKSLLDQLPGGLEVFIGDRQAKPIKCLNATDIAWSGGVDYNVSFVGQNYFNYSRFSEEAGDWVDRNSLDDQPPRRVLLLCPERHGSPSIIDIDPEFVRVTKRPRGWRHS